MSSNNGILSSPLKITEIRSLIGDTSYKLKALCQSNKINKWAVYKPQNISKTSPLTMTDRKNNNMGLSLVQLNKLKSTFTGSAIYSLADIEAEIREASYDVANQQFRMSDFLNGELVTSNGYNHNAKPTDADWANSSRPRSGIDTMRFVNFSANINNTSAGYIGQGNYDFMPLSYISDFTTDWRMAFAVYLTVGNRQNFQFAISDKSLNNISSSIDCIPNFMNNEYLQYLLRQQTQGTNESYSFTVIPCLLKTPNANMLQTTVVVGSTPYQSITIANSIVYAMPSGFKAFTLKLNKPLENYAWASDHPDWIRLRGSYWFNTPSGVSQNQELFYMVQGYQNAEGITDAGWFVTKITQAVSQQYDLIITYVIAYLTRVSGTNNFVSAQPPTNRYLTGVTGTLKWSSDGENRQMSLQNVTLNNSTYTISGVTIYGKMLAESVYRNSYQTADFTSIN